ncbi:MAG: helix-turn-helix transcriptional regulator [Anaerococcus sp.]|nr:helix-turn-helix transcriptional regulator [Anaerococcus sp.]
MDKLKEFGQKVREIRKARGLSQSDVEALSFISKKSISRIENGKQGHPSIDYLVELSKVYAYNLVDLFIATIYTSLQVLADIKKDLDVNAHLLSKRKLEEIDRRIGMIENDYELRNKGYELELLKLFIDSIRNKNDSSYDLGEKFRFITRNRINNKNILTNVYTPIELRLLSDICSESESYLGVSRVKILKSCTCQANTPTLLAVSSNSLATAYYERNNYRNALEALEKAIRNKDNAVSLDALVYLNYNKFWNLYKKNDPGYKLCLKNTLILARNYSNIAVYQTIKDKLKKFAYKCNYIKEIEKKVLYFR